ncbi:competence type IV pilus assembly protein ComGB [Solibacillus sp. CAU 1738]|uniref:competence type IV pilus assembly protein ComGB n=1 Tax=Solibacillus sp. CAU 1738 TaxID=3140363 RepID=UPI003260D418
MLAQLNKWTYTDIRFRRQIQVRQLPDFFLRMSTLLEEGYTFADCIAMLLPYHVKNYTYWEELIYNAFRDGAGPTKIFQLFGVDRQFLVAIQLAETTGLLASTLRVVAHQMEFQENMKTRLIKLLMYPILLFIFLGGLFIAFRLYFLPNIEQMVYSRTPTEKASSIQWTKFFLHVPDYFVVIFVCAVAMIVGGFLYIQRKRVDIQLHLLFRLPLIGYCWRLVLTRQFARSLGNLLVTGMSLQQSLEQLKEQMIQSQLAYVASVIERRIIFGDSLANSVKALSFFFPHFEQFIDHGEKSGLLGRELLIYAELLDEKLETILKSATLFVQPILFLVIAICVIAAYLSILLPMYQLLDIV